MDTRTPKILEKKISINNGWYFLDHSLDRGDAYHEDFVQFAKKINLPHSSNITDVYDNVKSYTRGTMLYQKKLQLSKSDLKGKRAYLYFEGVFQVADIYVNRNVVGRHEGGYTAFGYDITNMLTSQRRTNYSRTSQQCTGPPILRHYL